ncbi:MAG TPA: hypothetical protein VK501_25850 [Baekduia sp.]|nr:hypothetical protein [Baekduia sp.]HMJ37355.1 hypothetical protein [Baekduia sp.]
MAVRPHPADDRQRVILTLAGGALLGLAAAGALTLSRVRERARA